MRAKALLCGAALALFLAATSQAAAQQTAVPAATAPERSAALTRYEEGKRLYDAKDYRAARAKFAEAARLDPDNARWHYNLGLVHRQLDNSQAARQSFLHARALDPAYKKNEIDQKLKSMGFDPAAQTGVSLRPPAEPVTIPSPPLNPAPAAPPIPAPLPVTDDGSGFWAWVIGGGFLAGLSAFFIHLVRRRPQPAAAPATPPVDRARVEAEAQRLQAVSNQLIRIEHALRLGENADLRALLEHATLLEEAGRQQLERVAIGGEAALRKAAQHITEASRSAGQAGELATRLHGAAAFSEAGERVGCFFCARPLANPDIRQRVTLKQAAGQDDVTACPDCAATIARGESPRIRTDADGQTHWSEIPGFDPYSARHAATAGAGIPAWKFQPRQPMSTLAQLAGGGALLGAGALAGAGMAMAAGRLFDLDAARSAGLSEEALRESARPGRDRRDAQNDHS